MSAWREEPEADWGPSRCAHCRDGRARPLRLPTRAGVDSSRGRGETLGGHQGPRRRSPAAARGYCVVVIPGETRFAGRRARRRPFLGGRAPAWPLLAHATCQRERLATVQSRPTRRMPRVSRRSRRPPRPACAQRPPRAVRGSSFSLGPAAESLLTPALRPRPQRPGPRRPPLASAPVPDDLVPTPPPSVLLFHRPRRPPRTPPARPAPKTPEPAAGPRRTPRLAPRAALEPAQTGRLAQRPHRAAPTTGRLCRSSDPGRGDPNRPDGAGSRLTPATLAALAPFAPFRRAAQTQTESVETRVRGTSVCGVPRPRTAWRPLSLAAQSRRRGAKVLLLESARERFGPRSESPAEVVHEPPQSPPFLQGLPLVALRPIRLSRPHVSRLPAERISEDDLPVLQALAPSALTGTRRRRPVR